MTLDELVDYFDRVRMTGRGFTASCPAHDDKNPSLTITEGATSWLVACGVGCDFFDIVAAAGLHPLNFKIGDTWVTEASQGFVGMKGRDKMREMREKKGKVLTTLREIVEVALQPDPGWLTEMTDRWEMMGARFVDAMDMWHVVMDGPIFDVMHGGDDRWVKDWRVEKQQIGQKLWRTYRQHGPR